jgi:hypothetical protein
MSKKIPREKLLDLYERSINCLLPADQCAIWLPEVCELALDLLREKEAREKMIDMVKKVDDFKKKRKGE